MTIRNISKHKLFQDLHGSEGLFYFCIVMGLVFSSPGNAGELRKRYFEYFKKICDAEVRVCPEFGIYEGRVTLFTQTDSQGYYVPESRTTLKDERLPKRLIGSPKLIRKTIRAKDAVIRLREACKSSQGTQSDQACDDLGSHYLSIGDLLRSGLFYYQRCSKTDYCSSLRSPKPSPECLAYETIWSKLGFGLNELYRDCSYVCTEGELNEFCH